MKGFQARWHFVTASLALGQAEGIEQLESYLARLDVNEGWLFVFDRRKSAPPIEERLSTQVLTTPNNRAITVIRA